jgi:CRP-like cAMP-binding protein
MILSGNVRVEATAHEHDYHDAPDGTKVGNGRPAQSNRRGSVIKAAGAQAGAQSADKFTSKNKTPMGQHKRLTIKATLEKAGSVGKHMLKKKENGATDSTDSHQIELAQLHDGEYFGEMAAFIELPRAATVTTISDCLFATLSKSDFRSFIKVVPNIENSIEFMVRQHMLQVRARKRARERSERE